MSDNLETKTPEQHSAESSHEFCDFWRRVLGNHGRVISVEDLDAATERDRQAGCGVNDGE